MSYEKQNFVKGQILKADHLNHMEDGIAAAAVGVQGPKGDKGDVGPQGPKGDKGDTGPAAELDPTLSLSGKAADAKATGDAVSQLKEDLSDLSKEVVGYAQDAPAKYYKIAFDEVWRSKTGAVSPSAAVSEVSLLDGEGNAQTITSAIADSEYNDVYAASNVIDGYLTTMWSSKDVDGAVHELTLTLESPAIIKQLGVVPRAGLPDGVPNIMTVYASMDGSDWAEVAHFEELKDGWEERAWRCFDLSPFQEIDLPLQEQIDDCRTEFNSMRDNYTRVQGTELTLTDAAKSRIKRLVVTPNSPMSNDATPDNILTHGARAGLEATDAQGRVTAFEPDMRLICIPSKFTDIKIGGVSCAADICDWSARKLHRRFASYAFKGRESFKTLGSNAGCFANYRFTLPTPPTLTGNDENVIGLCTHYPYVSYIDIRKQTSGYGISVTAGTDGSHTLVVFDERFTTVDELMAYFAAQNDAGTPVTFYYMLNPVVEEEIGAEDFERFEGFLLPGGESTVTNPDGCMLEMDYWKDFPTRNYSDWMYEMLSLKEMRATAGSGSSGGGISLPNTVTVEEFGAVGDGLTDDTQAFVDALATGKNVLCMGEIYILSDRLNIMVAGQKLTGSGHTSLKFISTDPEKVGIDMRNTFCMLSGVALYGTGIGFGLRLGRYDPAKLDLHNKNRIDDVRIYDFEHGFTTTSKLNQSILSRIVIYRCEIGIYIPDVNPGGNYTAGVCELIVDSCLIDFCKQPYNITASEVYFNALNIGLEEDSQCYTTYGTYVFVNCKYESSPDSSVDQIIHLWKSSHVYISHHFSFTTSTPDTTCGFRANKGSGLVFIGCDYQSNVFPEPIVPVKHFIAPDSTFNTPRAVWFGPGERTHTTRLPRPILEDYPENRKYYVDFYDEVSVPAFDAETDEGKVLKIVDGVAQWVTP